MAAVRIPTQIWVGARRVRQLVLGAGYVSNSNMCTYFYQTEVCTFVRKGNEKSCVDVIVVILLRCQ